MQLKQSMAKMKWPDGMSPKIQTWYNLFEV